MNTTYDNIMESFDSTFEALAADLLIRIHNVLQNDQNSSELHLLLSTEFTTEQWSTLVLDDWNNRISSDDVETLEEIERNFPEVLETIFNTHSTQNLLIQIPTDEPTPFEDYFKGFESLSGWKSLKFQCAELGINMVGATVPNPSGTIQVGITIFSPDNQPLILCSPARNSTTGHHLN